MNPWNTLTPEQQMQVLIVRIDIVLVAIWQVLKIAVPFIILITLTTLVVIRLRRRRKLR